MKKRYQLCRLFVWGALVSGFILAIGGTYVLHLGFPERWPFQILIPFLSMFPGVIFGLGISGLMLLSGSRTIVLQDELDQDVEYTMIDWSKAPANPRAPVGYDYSHIALLRFPNGFGVHYVLLRCRPPAFFFVDERGAIITTPFLDKKAEAATSPLSESPSS